MNKRYIFSLVALASVPAFAQMDNTVEVETSVTPVVKDANKINVLPQVVESETVHNSVSYSNKLLQTKKYIFAPVDMMSPETVGEGPDKGFFSLGAGSAGNLDIHGAYGFNVSKNDVLGIRFSVDGFSCKNARKNTGLYKYGDKKPKSRFYTTRGAVDYTHKYAGGLSEFYIRTGLESQAFNYVAPASKETDKQNNSLGEVVIGTTDYKSNDFRMCGEFGYEFFNQKYLTNTEKKYTEGQAHINADFGVFFNEESSLNLDFGINSASYGMERYGSYTHAHVLPYYRFDDYDFSVKVGIYLGAGGVAPDLRFEYHASEYTDLYAQLAGYETENDFRAFNALNPYAMLPAIPATNGNVKTEDVKIKPEFHKLDFKAGVRFRSDAGFAGDFNLGYDKSKNRSELTAMSVATNNIVNQTFITFVDGGRFYANMDIVYNYDEYIKFDFKNQFNSWSLSKDDKYGIALARPMMDLDWNMDVKICDGFFVGGDLKIQSFKKTEVEDSKKQTFKAYKRPTTVDMGVTAHYVFPKYPLSIYANIDNLFNSNFDRFYGYRAVGPNFIIGAAITF
ncbi:MAG: TonB-dependent receptor [Bacteroidaceae bacterium]|nr:TonB-dependent receptor [Bacteroidaceae bacterium]